MKIVKKLQKLASFYNKTPAQIAIRWVLDNPFVTCALTGIKQPGQIEQNVGVFGWKLSKEDREYINKT